MYIICITPKRNWLKWEKWSLQSGSAARFLFWKKPQPTKNSVLRHGDLERVSPGIGGSGGDATGGARGYCARSGWRAASLSVRAVAVQSGNDGSVNAGESTLEERRANRNGSSQRTRNIACCERFAAAGTGGAEFAGVCGRGIGTVE